jgi:hypothetical protein
VLPADPLPFDKTVHLPPLVSSKVIPGLPPPPSPASWSKLQETKQSLERIAKRWKLQSFEPQGISFTNFVHGGAVDTDRFVAISILYTIHFMLDDIVYDAPNVLALEKKGISGSACKSLETAIAFLKHVGRMFRQQEPLPESSPPFDGVIWKLGHDMRRLSTPEWFIAFADALLEYQNVLMSCHASHRIAGNSVMNNLS